jgi:N-acetylneuraminic acid mutarotase
VTDDHSTSGTKAQYVKVIGAPTSNYGVEDWIWFSGSKYANSVGNFQSQSTTQANPLNQPSARQLAATWTAPGTTNSTGKLWMFGGGGYDSTGTAGFLNDLWYYTPGACAKNALSQTYCGTWTWVSGSNKANTLGVYTMDANGNPTYSATNMPGARSAAAHWTDAQGNFWLFGGNGYDSVGNLGNLNDLWVFNGTTGQANWIGGSAKTNSTGATTPAYPGARSYATTWTDQSGRFWLFGGESLNSAGTASVDLNDLWYFTPSVTQDATTKAYVYSGTWTQVASGAANTGGVYGTQGTAATTNYPGARINAQAWVEGTGKIWMFGGSGIDGSGNSGALNDMWSYDISSNSWTWVAGSSIISAAEVAGTLGTAASGNTPSARLGTSGWTDTSGTVLWLFGGSGTDSTGTSTSSDGGGALSELWAFNTQTHLWAFMGGSPIAGTAGVFANDIGVDTGLYYSTPGSRLWGSGWVDANGHFWLYGGTGDDMSGTSGYLNDLWQVKIVLAPK